MTRFISRPLEQPSYQIDLSGTRLKSRSVTADSRPHCQFDRRRVIVERHVGGNSMNSYNNVVSLRCDTLSLVQDSKRWGDRCYTCRKSSDPGTAVAHGVARDNPSLRAR